MAAIYMADVWCDDCAEEIRNDIWTGRDDEHAELDRDEWEAAVGFDDERNYDSDEYPKYCADSEESDCPQHCAGGEDCCNPAIGSDGTKYGYFFGNDLTSDGDDYVRDAVREDRQNGRDDSPTCEFWAVHYDYIDFDDCEGCDG